MHPLFNYDVPAPAPLRTWRCKHGPRRLVELDPARTSELARLPSPPAGPAPTVPDGSPRQGPKSIRLAQLNPELVRRLDEARPRDEDSVAPGDLSRSSDVAAFLRDPVQRLPPVDGLGLWMSSPALPRSSPRSFSQGLSMTPPMHCRRLRPPHACEVDQLRDGFVQQRFGSGTASHLPDERQGYLFEIRELRQRCSELSDSIYRQGPRFGHRVQRRDAARLKAMQEWNLRLAHHAAAFVAALLQVWRFHSFGHRGSELYSARWREQAMALLEVRTLGLLQGTWQAWALAVAGERALRAAEQHAAEARSLGERLAAAEVREAANSAHASEVEAAAEAHLHYMESLLVDEQARRATAEAHAAQTPRARSLRAGAAAVTAAERGIRTAVLAAWRTAVQTKRELASLRSKQLVEEANRTGLLQAQRRECDAKIREAEGKYAELLQKSRCELSEQETRHQEMLAQQQAEASSRAATLEALSLLRARAEARLADTESSNEERQGDMLQQHDAASARLAELELHYEEALHALQEAAGVLNDDGVADLEAAEGLLSEEAIELVQSDVTDSGPADVS